MAQSIEEQYLDGVPVPAASLPHRRLRLVLDLEADDLTELAAAMIRLANELELDGAEQVEGASGGVASGHHFTLTCDPTQTGDRYREQLSRWSVDRRLAVLNRKFREASDHG